jgi:hypothetical protein
MTDPTPSLVEEMARAFLVDLRDRRLLKYLFAKDPGDCGPYGLIDEPIDTETQQEIVTALAQAALAIVEPKLKALEEAQFNNLVKAYQAGAYDVHDHWADAGEGERFCMARDETPDFTEAAHDKARALLNTRAQATRMRELEEGLEAARSELYRIGQLADCEHPQAAARKAAAKIDTLLR